MWLYGMTREECKDFLKENLDKVLDVLMTAYLFTMDEIITEHLSDEVDEYLAEGHCWEAC